MKLKSLTLSDLEQVRQWRNKCPEALRTPFLLTQERQEQFYRDVICVRQKDSRYWGIVVDDVLVGMCGLENIQWENRLAEISIILNPDYQGKGYGEKAVGLLLDQGFNHLNLENIFGECYLCNPAVEFWNKVAQKYNAVCCHLPNRKYWQGKYYDSLYFNIAKER